MPQRTVVVGSAVGLHARPAALFVKAAGAAPVPIRVAKPGGSPVDPRSILSVLALDARGGQELVLTADREGADAALDVVAAVVTRDWDAE